MTWQLISGTIVYDVSEVVNIRISDAILIMVYKNNGRLELNQVSGYIGQLIQYGMLEINEGEFSVSLADKGKARLRQRGLLK